MDQTPKITLQNGPIDSDGIQLVRLDQVLLACAHIGKLLQGIPKEKRKLTISRLRNVGRDCINEGLALDAAMIAVLAQSWDDFEN